MPYERPQQIASRDMGRAPLFAAAAIHSFYKLGERNWLQYKDARATAQLLRAGGIVMAEKFSEATWTAFSKKQKLDLRDAPLVKALAKFDKTSEDKPEPRLDAERAELRALETLSLIHI